MAQIAGRSVPESIVLGAGGEALGTVSAQGTAIASGESLSAPLDLVGNRVVAIKMPAAWTAADLTFQGSADGVNYGNLYDDEGNEVTVVAAVDRHIVVDPIQFLGVRYIKVRSGTAGAAVNQAGIRNITLIGSS